MSPHPLPHLRALPTVLVVAAVIVLGLWLAHNAQAAEYNLLLRAAPAHGVHVTATHRHRR